MVKRVLALVQRWRAEIAIIAVGVTLAVATLASTSPTADEEKHIANGHSFQTRGRALNDETPAAMLHSVLIPSDRLALASGRTPTSLWEQPDAWDTLVRSRVFTAAAFLWLLVVVALWAHALFPPETARIVLALAATAPTLLAHASVATADMFLTAAAFATCHALFRYQREPSTDRALVVGGLAGLTLLAKISGLFLYGTIVVVFAWLVLRERTERRRTRLGRLAIVIALPLVLLNVGYGFKQTFKPMRSYSLHSETLQNVAKSALGAVPLPIPANFVQAVDFSIGDRVRRLDRDHLAAYMLGESYVGKRLGYFPFAFLVKTSGVILALFAIGIWRGRPKQWLALVAFPVVFLLTNIFLNAFDIGIRYILPIYPFVILWCGFALERIGRRIAIAAALVHFVWTLVAFPNYLASFNFISWFVPKDYLLSDSNLDWGQMNHRVTADLAKHPTTAPVRMCTIGPVIGQSHRSEFACPWTALDGRFYVSTTIERLGHFNFTRHLRHGPTRTLADVIHVYEVTSEADFAATFINEWEVSMPFRTPANPEDGAWMARDTEPFLAGETRFGLLDISKVHGAALTNTCVLARSAKPVAGDVLIGADDTMYVYDRGKIIARDTRRSGLDWPQTIVKFAEPTQLRLMLCNERGDFAVQAGVR